MSWLLLRAVKRRAEAAAGALPKGPPAQERQVSYRRQARLVRLINHGVARLAALGLIPSDAVALQVTGRRPGKPHAVALTWAEYESEQAGAQQVTSPRRAGVLRPGAEPYLSTA